MFPVPQMLWHIDIARFSRVVSGKACALSLYLCLHTHAHAGSKYQYTKQALMQGKSTLVFILLYIIKTLTLVQHMCHCSKKAVPFSLSPFSLAISLLFYPHEPLYYA